MADQITLTAHTGRPTGTRSSRRLRATGKIPAVVYGAGSEPTPVAVEWTALRAALTTDAGMNALITLDVDGDERLTIVKDMQRDPIRRDVTHVDFIVIDRNKSLDVDVPLHLVNVDSPHLNELVVDQIMFTMPVAAKPGSIPNELEVDCASLTLDDPIRAEHIVLPAGVELNVEPEEVVVAASVPQAEVEPEAVDEDGEAVADEEAAAEEGGEPEAAGADDGDGGDAADGGDDSES